MNSAAYLPIKLSETNLVEYYLGTYLNWNLVRNYVEMVEISTIFHVTLTNDQTIAVQDTGTGSLIATDPSTEFNFLISIRYIRANYRDTCGTESFKHAVV